MIPATASVTGGWDSSYVDGPLTKTGNTAFTFPLGSNNIYAPVSITAPYLNTDAFTAQYFKHPAYLDGYDTSLLDGTLNHLSRKEYWTLDRTNGNASVQVTLSWKAERSGAVTALSDLRIAHWNGSIWRDEGNGETIGTNAAGTIRSLNTIGYFSPFTLASIGLTNPLPVHFLFFDARLNANRTVLIEWKTAEKINNDHFEVQRSNDFINWTTIKTVIPSSTGIYSYIDNIVPEGISYYRVKQVDLNGSYVFTETKRINLGSIREPLLWPNPATTELYIQLPCNNAMISISDEQGKVIDTRQLKTNNAMLPVSGLKAGTYFLRIKCTDEWIVRKFVKM